MSEPGKNNNPVLRYIKLLERVFFDVTFTLLKTLNIEYDSLLNMDVDDVTRYYRQCRDAEVMDRCFELGLQGIDYKDSSKCGTDYYINYMNDMNDDDIQDEKTVIYKQLGIRVAMKPPAYLVRKGKAARQILNG